MGKKTKITLTLLGVLLLGMQLYRPERINPVSDPALSFQEVEKPSPELTALLKRSCMNCHSHQTAWPWYSNLAPASWLVASDVEEGREHLNFSEWGRLPQEKQVHALEEICEEARSGAMPPWQYRLLHPQARLSEQDVKLLCAPPLGSR
ncbi:MAG: heme-binding domain-containing protein [Bryobacteraceae bacterium]|nr:heme-binding domain-containing protein [Bryobacteraceae bacterium]